MNRKEHPDRDASLGRSDIYHETRHPDRDASLSGCRWNLSLACSTERCIPNGIRSIRRLKPSVPTRGGINKGACPLAPLAPLLNLIFTSFHKQNNRSSRDDANPLRPHYLINTFKNEVMRLITRGRTFSTEVVQLLKLGRNEVINVNFNKPLFPKRLSKIRVIHS